MRMIILVTNSTMANGETNVKFTWLKQNGKLGKKICSVAIPENTKDKEFNVLMSIGYMLFGNRSYSENMVDEGKVFNDIQFLAHSYNKHEVQITSKGTRLRVHLTATPDKQNYQYLCEIKSPVVQINNELKPLNFAQILDLVPCSDVTIFIEGKTIYAHKVIIAEKSAGFRGLFKYGEEEPSKSFVKKISTGYTYETVYELMFYIYNGTTTEDDDNNKIFLKYSNLLKADNDFVVDGLMELCESKLISIMTIDNVVDCLLVADSCNALNLKWHAINYVAYNPDQLVGFLTNEKFSLLQHGVFEDIVKVLVQQQNE